MSYKLNDNRTDESDKVIVIQMTKAEFERLEQAAVIETAPGFFWLIMEAIRKGARLIKIGKED
jgi:hypothetical protein